MLKEEAYSKIGEPPGTLTYIGGDVSESTRILLHFYDNDSQQDKELSLGELNDYVFDDRFVYWVDVIGNHESDYVKSIGDKFSINHLFLEDVMNSNQRPKYESFENNTLVILKDVHFGKDNYSLEFEHICVFLFSGIILSFRQNPGNKNFEMLNKRIIENSGMLRKKKADYLLYALMDSIMDSYLAVIDKVDDILTEFEEHFIETPDMKSLKDIYRLKREMAVLKKIFIPIRNLIRDLEHFFSLNSENYIFIRDLYDHALQVSDNLETIREIISGMFELYLSSNGNRMNVIMKTLTLISSIFIPLSFITGFYGMNFVHIPGLDSEYGALAVFLAMVLISGFMILFFKIKKWF